MLRTTIATLSILTIEGAEVKYLGDDATLNGEDEREIGRPFGVAD